MSALWELEKLNKILRYQSELSSDRLLERIWFLIAFQTFGHRQCRILSLFTQFVTMEKLLGSKGFNKGLIPKLTKWNFFGFMKSFGRLNHSLCYYHVSVNVFKNTNFFRPTTRYLKGGVALCVFQFPVPENSLLTFSHNVCIKVAVQLDWASCLMDRLPKLTHTLSGLSRQLCNRNNLQSGKLTCVAINYKCLRVANEAHSQT